MEITGGCYCGAVRYRVEADGTGNGAGFCHCNACRKFSGGAGSAVFAVMEGAEVSGEVLTFEHKADSGNTVIRAACAKCRSPVYMANTMMEQMRVFHAGTLDDPAIFAPRMRIYCGIAAPWALPEKEELPRFDAMPKKGGG